MSVSIILFLGTLRLSAPLQENFTALGYDEVYFELPRFWTNTGLCPAGDINHNDISNSLLSPAMQMNLQYVAALPVGAITHVRIHWLLELIEFVQFSQSGVPIYDFTKLDTFLMNLMDLGLHPVIEFMANPGDVFVKNPNRNDFLWEDFSYQVTRHYLNILGATELLQWRFESWNEPDSHTYNKLNFTIEDYLTYLTALRRGLYAAGRRNEHSLHFPLRGPAGLFKSESKHPLCWKILQQCDADIKHCPFEVLTYHRKGKGLASQVLTESKELLEDIQTRFPQLKNMPIANDEADPIAGWSEPRDFQEDVHYAVILASIILDHWRAKLDNGKFKHFETISHDNSFLSYHPHAFSQRTLLAHFRMNNTQPPHSQFIQKPVYAALGLLAKLGPFAAHEETLHASNGQQVRLLRTTATANAPQYLSWLLVTGENTTSLDEFQFERGLPIVMNNNISYVLIVEVLEYGETDPVHIWRAHNSPAYPDDELREAMRRHQTPRLLTREHLHKPELRVSLGAISLPWMLLLRVCESTMPLLVQPQNLQITGVTQGEVLLTWREVPHSTQCLLRYEVFYTPSLDDEWRQITDTWHVPFPSFQFAPTNEIVNGFYKVHGVDVFNRNSVYSDIVEYFEF